MACACKNLVLASPSLIHLIFSLCLQYALCIFNRVINLSQRTFLKFHSGKLKSLSSSRDSNRWIRDFTLWMTKLMEDRLSCHCLITLLRILNFSVSLLAGSWCWDCNAQTCWTNGMKLSWYNQWFSNMKRLPLAILEFISITQASDLRFPLSET